MKAYGTYLQLGLHVLALLPLLWLLWQVGLLLNVQAHALTANPFQYVNQYTGDWAIRFLLLSLAITPLRRALKQNWLIRWRRPLGLYAFVYALLHLTNYLVLDHFFDWAVIWKDLVKRPAMMLGMVAFVLLLPLAATSTKTMIRRLGRLWSRLHRLVYLIAALAVGHHLMMVKADLREPLIHLAILSFLLVLRFYRIISTGPKRTLPDYLSAKNNELGL
ncbi:sulfite oxidase heme-binding subunit YedZ [Luteithermobacter gelatinilyticus]|uniref:sulfite oxidase heme-binding subunit YedZ n=1 Tax=Luteithermobacter gelatinilyticus TaxID=2582913 RepID=UPI0011071117|nr:protein-methionine-sulfoxide reductase heme-binding subunit MsrQ [Luteithermobacter gelatinilyticus]